MRWWRPVAFAAWLLAQTVTAGVAQPSHLTRGINLTNWFRFPRTAPAPGMAAVRRHHVFVLEQHLGGNMWLVYDANSGRGRTQRHARSIAGYAVVNPRA